MPSAATTPRARLVCLTGFMGCGKSTVGRLLAGQLGWRFADLDEEIEAAAGLSISAIFERSGESAFREIESRTLARLLGRAATRGESTVLALGGGTVAQPQNLPLLEQAGAALVWLDCPLDVLLLRCVGMTNRPLFRDEASFRELYAQRRPFYERAPWRVDAAAAPRQVAERILALAIFDPVRA